MMIKLDYVSAERTATGWRYRFRRHRNGPKVTLKGEPGSAEFMAHYEALLDDVPQPASLARHGSVEWLVTLYLRDLSDKVAANLKSPLTLKSRQHHLGRLVEAYGVKNANMPRSAVIKLTDRYARTPAAADNLLKAISALYIWAIQRDLVTCENPARDVKRISRKTDGYAPWSLAEIRQYLAHHPRGSTPNLAMVLAMTLTARRADLCLLGRQHEFTRGGRRWIGWTQTKSPNARVELPMPAALIEAVEGRANMTYLLTSFGAPYSVAGLGNAFRKWADDAGIERRSLHGVRKGMSAILAAEGANSHEIDVVLGHEIGSRETQVYTRAAQRTGLAESVIDRLDRIIR